MDLHQGQTKEGIKLGSTREEVEEVYGELEWDRTEKHSFATGVSVSSSASEGIQHFL